MSRFAAPATAAATAAATAVKLPPPVAAAPQPVSAAPAFYRDESSQPDSPQHAMLRLPGQKKGVTLGNVAVPAHEPFLPPDGSPASRCRRCAAMQHAGKAAATVAGVAAAEAPQATSVASAATAAAAPPKSAMQQHSLQPQSDPADAARLSSSATGNSVSSMASSSCVSQRPALQRLAKWRRSTRGQTNADAAVSPIVALSAATQPQLQLHSAVSPPRSLHPPQQQMSATSLSIHLQGGRQQGGGRQQQQQQLSEHPGITAAVHAPDAFAQGQPRPAWVVSGRELALRMAPGSAAAATHSAAAPTPDAVVTPAVVQPAARHSRSNRQTQPAAAPAAPAAASPSGSQPVATAEAVEAVVTNQPAAAAGKRLKLSAGEGSPAAATAIGADVAVAGKPADGAVPKVSRLICFGFLLHELRDNTRLRDNTKKCIGTG